MAAALFTACTQDELAEQGNTLPDGEYPLQIGSVSITAEASEEPWTRVTEKPDGSGSVWQPDDAITVSLNGETATYTYDGSAWTSDAPLYWKNTQTAEVTAWYPATDGVVNLSDQDRNGLTYVLRGTGTGNHQSPVSLGFTHSLAKVRVKLKGERASQVTNVEVYGFTSCTNTQGTLATDADSQGWITTKSCIYNGESCWEANLVPGEIGDQTTQPFVRLNETTVVPVSTLTTLEAGNVHTITITANSEGTQTIDLSNEDCIINDDGTYYFSGTASHAIRVTGGNPEIYLEDAEISVTGGNGIDITGGASPTIHVRGENTIANNSIDTDGAGIYVAEGSTVTITGRDRNDVLTAQGGNNGAGIGGYGRPSEGHTSCGDITISNVTVHAYSAGRSFDYPGIGSRGACGTIAIDNATVYARGTGTSDGGYPAIGANSTVPVITISGSEIHAFRGSSHADWIGQYGNVYGYQGGAIQGTITGTTVYKGLWDKNSGQATDEGIVEYGVDDVGTEQSQ